MWPKKYSDRRWQEENKMFYVTSLRGNQDKGGPTAIALWEGDYAAQAHIQSVGMLNGWGLIDLCSMIEDFIFDFFQIFLTYNPKLLLEGDDYKHLKKLYKDVQDPTKRPVWEKEFNVRLINWRRKRLYDGLSKVFLSYCKEADIKQPSHYKDTTPET